MFEDFIKEKQYLRNISLLTIKSYRQAYKRFEKTGAIEISKRSLDDFVIKMREDGLSPVSCNISIRSMNAYLSWLHENGYTSERFRIAQLKVEKKVIKPYGDEQLKRILSWKPSTFHEHRLYALLATLIDTGCRIDELLKLDRPHIDFDNLLITVTGKGNKERVIPISIELRKVLYRFLRSHNSDAVFPCSDGSRAGYRSVLRQWELLCEKLKLDYRGFHSVRHNYGLNFIRQGGDISELQRLLGHSSITTTAIYVNLQTEDLARAQARTSILSRLR